MRVLWLTNTPALGEEYLKKLSVGGGWLKGLNKELQEQVELHIAFHYSKPARKFQYQKTAYYPIFKKNWRLEILRSIVFNTVYDDEFLSHYIEIIQEVDPDIIHIHGTENSFGCIVGQTNKPTVISIQGILNVITNRFTIGLDSNLLRGKRFSIDKGIKSYVLTKSFLSVLKKLKKMAVLEARTLSKIKYVIGRTDWDRRVTSVLALNAKYFVGDEILRDGFYKHSWGKSRGAIFIIHSTLNFNYYKGFETICHCLNLLNKMEIDVVWNVAGIKKDDLIVTKTRKRLKKEFPKHGLNLKGQLREEEMIDLMCNSDVYVMPSHIENSSNGLCEAMLIGMPCISTNVGGSDSLIDDKRNGLLVQDADPWEMAGAILEIYHSAPLANRIGKEAQINARFRHDKERVSRQYKEIYYTILQSENESTSPK